MSRMTTRATASSVKPRDKRLRRALIVRRAAAAKKAAAMREWWRRRRGGDEDASASSDDDHAGSPDALLNDLPDLVLDE